MPRGTNRGDWEKLERYQVRDGEELTFEEIGDVLGCSKQRAEQLVARALRRFAFRAALARLKELV